MSEDPAAQQPRHAAPRRLPNGRIEPTVADMVFVALNTPGFAGARGLNVCIWSDPGHGKTKTVEQVIDWAGRRPYGLVLTRVAPEDMTGIPFRVDVWTNAKGEVVSAAGKTEEEMAKDGATKQTFTVKAPDLQFVNISKDPKAVIIFDDATNSTPAVQAAALDILLEKKFSDGSGGTVSLKHVPMVLMANHGEGASLTPLLSPVANRMMHIWMTSRDVLMWWASRRLPQVTINTNKLRSLEQNWSELETEAWDMVNDYIIEKGVDSDRVNGVRRLDRPWSMDTDLPSKKESEYGKAVFDTPTPQEFNDVEQYAFATSRSWEFAVRWMAACKHFGIDDTRGIVGAIGTKQAKPFLEWRRQRELVAATFANKVNWDEVKPSEQHEVCKRAAREWTTDEQLEGMLKSFDRLARKNGGSEDVFRDAREYLLDRAISGEHITPGQVFLIRAHWPLAFKQRSGPADGMELSA